MLIGNATRDPEIRYTPKGTAVTELSLAINRVSQNSDGERREEVTYVEVVVWARLAEICEQYIKKGNPVFIEGRLQLDTWDDKQTGQKRSRLRVVAENLQLLGGRDDAQRGSSNRDAARQTKPAGVSERPKDPDLDVEPDDIPF